MCYLSEFNLALYIFDKLMKKIINFFKLVLRSFLKNVPVPVTSK